MEQTNGEKSKNSFLDDGQLARKLQEALEYAENIVLTIREPLLVLDADLRIITASQSFYRVFSAKPLDTVGKLIYEVAQGQWNIPELRNLLEEILPKNTKLDDFEVDHDFPGLGRRVMLLNARRMLSKGLGSEKILMAIEDITERKEREARLEKTRKELEVIKKSADEASEFAQSIVNTVREPLISLDQDLRVVTVSRSFYEFFKVKPEETVGQLIYDLGNKQWDIPKLRELLETILPQKATFDNYEVEHDFATIGRRILLLNARQIQRVSGKERIILLAIEDITGRKEREARLEKTRKELEVIKKSADEASEFAQSIVNTVREPLISLDQDLRVVMVSRSFYEFFKVKPEETVGQLIYDLGNKQWDIPKLRELLETILPQKATFDNYEVEHDFTTIGRRILLLNARQIQRVSGKERIILLAIEDITERKKAEEEVARSNKELQQFAYVTSHDLREPLRMITSFTQSLEKRYKDKLDQTANEYIEFIVDGTARMQDLIDDILAYSRVGTRGIPFEPVNLEKVINDVLVNLKVSIEETRARITHDPLPIIQGDPIQMTQVMQNLIANAIKFHQEGEPPVVHLSAALERGEWVFSVKDNGIGIDPELFGRLFTLFSTLNPRDKYPGSGVGLAITKRIIERHGGRIWVESQPGKGSTFYFSLPASPKKDANDQR